LREFGTAKDEVKNAIGMLSDARGLYVRLTAALHNRLPGDTTWLQRAVTGWNVMDPRKQAEVAQVALRTTAARWAGADDDRAGER